MRRLKLLTGSVISILLYSGFTQLTKKNQNPSLIEYEIFNTQSEKLTFLWENPETNQPFSEIRKVCDYYKNKGKKITFITNGGIYDKSYKPAGLYVENGEILKPLNQKDADGNFYLKPNGVFLVTKDNKAEIVESKNYHKSLNVKHAVQSGPMLLIDGNIHPKFNKNSKHRKHRSGVGIDDRGQVFFVMSKNHPSNRPTFYQFAAMFKRLGCKNALFLDGTISLMQENPTGKENQSFKFVTMIAIIENNKEKE